MGGGDKLCECPECGAERQPPPPVTGEMRARWAAMGIPLTMTPKPMTRKQYKDLHQPRRDDAGMGGA